MGTLLLLMALLIGGCFPPINPPVPPTPIPDPLHPIPAAGFRVLIVYDSTAPITAEQLGAMNGTKLAELLNTKCVKTASGLPEWRVWDQATIDEAGLSDESEVWRTIWGVAVPQLTKLPAVVIVVGNKTRVLSLPATEAETLKLIRDAQ